MSHDQNTSRLTFDQVVKAWELWAYQNPSPRSLAMAAEAQQRYVEYLDEVQKHVKADSSVTVSTEGTNIRFADVDGMADWLAENLSHSKSQAGT